MSGTVGNVVRTFARFPDFGTVAGANFVTQAAKGRPTGRCAKIASARRKCREPSQFRSVFRTSELSAVGVSISDNILLPVLSRLMSTLTRNLTECRVSTSISAAIRAHPLLLVLAPLKRYDCATNCAARKERANQTNVEDETANAWPRDTCEKEALLFSPFAGSEAPTAKVRLHRGDMDVVHSATMCRRGCLAPRLEH